MKILHIDTGNIRQCQMTETFMRSFTKNDQVLSARNNTEDKEGNLLHGLVIQAMKIAKAQTYGIV